MSYLKNLSLQDKNGIRRQEEIDIVEKRGDQLLGQEAKMEPSL